MSARFTLDDVRERTYKARDAWWTVLLVDPVASRLVVPVANRTAMTPNRITTAGFALGVVAAVLFWLGSRSTLVLAAIAFHLSFVLDCMDGKLARLKGTGTVLGAWIDYILDRLRVLACSVGLFGGLYASSHDAIWAWLAFAVVFADMLRYLDAVQIRDLYVSMRAGITEAGHAAGRDVSGYLALLGGEAAPAAVPGRRTSERRSPDERGGGDADGPETTVARRFGWFTAVQRSLRARRIRPHLLSGVELEMFVFILGPLAAAAWGDSALVVVTIASVALLALFELAIVYMTVLAARDYAVVIDTIGSGRMRD